MFIEPPFGVLRQSGGELGSGIRVCGSGLEYPGIGHGDSGLKVAFPC